MYNDFNENRPTNGLLVFTSYNPRVREGSYAIVRLEDGKVVCKEYVNRKITSDNLMGVTAVTKAIDWANKNDYGEMIYLLNTVSITWLKKQYCKSSFLDPKEGLILKQWFETNAVASYAEKLQHWDRNWLKPQNPLKRYNW